MRIKLALLLFAVSCGVSESPVEHRTLPGSVPEDCPFTFGDNWAMETTTGRRLLAHGSGTDYASVVTVIAHANTADCSPVIIYQSGDGDCTKGALQSVPMVYTGADPGGESFTGVIPSGPKNAQVCWRVSASACGISVADPSAGPSGFDYTNR